MQIVVIGGAGVLGQALLRAIVARGALTRGDGVPAPVRRVIAIDRAQPAKLFVESRVEYVRAGVGGARLMQAVMGTLTDSVFHVWDRGAGGGEPTPSFALSDSLRDLFAACELQPARPKVVLAGSFAAESDATNPSPAHSAPLRSREGLTALIGELLLEEAARRGKVDGRALRLALIAGAPGDAAFLGELVPALFEGRPARCPIPGSTPMWLTSAPAAARALLHAHELPAAVWAKAGVLNAPACTLSVDALMQAVARLTGRPATPPDFQTDVALSEALAQHPSRVAIEAALTLGFEDGLDAEALVRDLTT
jgi:nucleoside-diphosphate-sugar epimerase